MSTSSHHERISRRSAATPQPLSETTDWALWGYCEFKWSNTPTYPPWPTSSPPPLPPLTATNASHSSLPFSPSHLLHPRLPQRSASLMATFTSLPLVILLLLFLTSISFTLVSSAPKNQLEKSVLLSHPTSITLTHLSSMSPLPPHNVTLTPDNLCITCHVVFHEFFRFVISSINQEQYEGQVEASALASLFCQGDPFSHFHPFYSAGCQELLMTLEKGKVDSAGVNVTLEDFLAPLIGQRTVKYYTEFPLRELLAYKRRTCQRVAHCPLSPDPIGVLPTHPSPECRDCDSAVKLMAEGLGREADIDAPDVLDNVLRSLCMEVAFWWEKPAGGRGRVH